MAKRCPKGFIKKNGKCIRILELTKKESEALVRSIDDDLNENQPDDMNPPEDWYSLRNIIGKLGQDKNDYEPDSDGE